MIRISCRASSQILTKCHISLKEKWPIFIWRSKVISPNQHLFRYRTLTPWTIFHSNQWLRSLQITLMSFLLKNYLISERSGPWNNLKLVEETLKNTCILWRKWTKRRKSLIYLSKIRYCRNILLLSVFKNILRTVNTSRSKAKVSRRSKSLK